MMLARSSPYGKCGVNRKGQQCGQDNDPLTNPRSEAPEELARLCELVERTERENYHYI
jgi:hypothetical protein